MKVSYEWKQVTDLGVIKRANTLWVILIIDRLVLPLLYLIANFTFLTPNMVTVLGMLLTFPSAYFFATGSFVAGMILQQAVLLCDAIDGKLARLTHRTSPFGKLYDNLVDRMRSLVPMLGLIYFTYNQTQNAWFVFWGLFYLVWDLLLIYMYHEAKAMNENKLLVDIVQKEGSFLSKIRQKLMKHRLTLLYSDIESEVVVFIIGPLLSFYYGYEAILNAMIVGTGMLALIFVIFFAVQCKIAWSQKKSQ